MTRKREGFNTLPIHVSFITEQRRGSNTLAFFFFCVSNATGRVFHLLVVFLSLPSNDEGSTPSPFAFLLLPSNGKGSTPSPLLLLLFPSIGEVCTLSVSPFSLALYNIYICIIS